MDGRTAQTGSERLVALRSPRDRLGVDARGVLTIEGHAADALVHAHGTPLYVIAASALRANYHWLHDAFAGAWAGPVRLLQSTKGNYSPAVRAVLASEGAGAECFSRGEIEVASSTRNEAPILLTATNKPRETVRTAIERGIVVNIDHPDEIGVVVEESRRTGRRARLLLRLKPFPRAEQSSEWMDPAVLSGLALYEVGLTADEALAAVQDSNRLPETELLGFHCHNPGVSSDLRYFEAWAAALGDSIRSLTDASAYTPAVIDIGGGWPTPGRSPSYGIATLNLTPMRRYAEVAVGTLQAKLGDLIASSTELWIEPGRSLLGSAGLLLSTVGVTKKRSVGPTVLVDASMSHLMRRELYGWHFHALPATQMNAKDENEVSIRGTLCTGGDLVEQRPWPRLRAGDLIAFLDAGGYSEVHFASYNAAQRPATLLVDGCHVDTITKREGLEEFMSRFEVPERLRG